MINYEYPINERIRTLLRLEDLFARTGHFIAGKDSMAHFVALTSLFEILEVSSRSDLKSDLLQELERQKQILESLRANPSVSETALNGIINEIEKTSSDILSIQGKVGQHLRENEWLMNIKQRTCIPGGSCEFDLPSFHYWLNLDSAHRKKDLERWFSPFSCIRDSIAIILKILRDSGKPSRQMAKQGTFQQMLTGRPLQMISIGLDSDLPCVPEISANKYALNVRFVTVENQMRPKTYENEVAFTINFYSL